VTTETCVDDQPVVEAEEFVLRPLRDADAGLIRLHAGDARVARMTRSIPHPLPPGAPEEFLRRVRAPGHEEDVWAIDATVRGGPELVGLIGLTRMEDRPTQAEIAFWVGHAWWNTGIASRAVQALVAANPLGHEALFATVFQDNPASARVLTNCGFEYLGDAESFSIARGGLVPTWTYSLKLSGLTGGKDKD